MGGLQTLVEKLGKPRWLAVFFKLADQIDMAGPVAMMDRLNCDSIYEDKALSSGRWHGVKGLGAELLR